MFFLIFTLFLSYDTIQPYDNNLWQQIIPLIKRKEINKTPNMQEILKDCTIQAIIIDGDNPKPLDSETLHTLQSLHIFSEILPKIASCNLHWGYFQLAKNICQITDDPQILLARNNFNIYLQDHPQLTAELKELLKNLKNTESDFLLHFYFKLLQQNEYTPSNPIEEGFYYLKLLEKKILSNRYTGELYKLTMQYKTILSICASLSTLYYFSDFHNLNISKCAWVVNKTPAFNYSDTIASSWPISIPWTTIMTLGTLVSIGVTTKSLKDDFDQTAQKQKSVLLFKNLITTSEKIVKIVEKNPTIEQFLPEYMTIKKFGEYKIHPEFLSEKMNHLLTLLDYFPFNQEEANVFPLCQGKIHETFILYEELKHEIVLLWQAIGSLDAHLCIQAILANYPNYFSIPQWIENNSPILQIKDYWHPLISPQKVIKNSISLGCSGIAQNIIITGANAGGKTTAMSAIMLCAVFAQSLGIVPAQSYQATPFARMHTYVDITTNLAANESLFVAQANRAKHLYESIQSCRSNQKSISFLDEIFTGTRADFAEKASFEFAQKLGAISNSICMIATHFAKLTELEKTGLFTNYHTAPATINFDGSLHYPYLIIPGISEQNIAEIILKRNGIIA